MESAINLERLDGTKDKKGSCLMSTRNVKVVPSYTL